MQMEKQLLMSVSENGHDNAVQVLINNEANVNEQDIIGNTALMLASENGH